MHPHYTIPDASGIYRITCTVTGKFYIGSAANLRIRRLMHFSQLRRNIHHNPKLQHAWNKYGEDAFTFEVLELVLPMSLTAREQYWFQKLKPFGDKGYNIDRVAGSRLGMKHTPETLEKMRLAGLGNTRSLGKKLSPERNAKLHTGNIGNKYSLGYKHTAETRDKMQESKRDKMQTLIVTSPDGTEYLVHGINAFCRKHHLAPGELSRVTKGKYRHHRGWKARYLD